MPVTWKKTHFGWHAYVNGKNLTVRAYRRGDGKGFGYVARVDQSASSSPAKPHATAALAKREALAMAGVR